MVTSGRSVGINPLSEELDFGDLPPGAQLTRFVTLRNRGARPSYVCVVALGGIAELIRVSPTRFVLGSNDDARVAFKLRVPPSAPKRTHTGLVLIFKLPYFSV
jgi:hypothetical protein